MDEQQGEDRMLRDEAIAALAAARNGALSVATMQTVLAWHEAGQAAEDHIDNMGCMGTASGLGLGLALARPDRKVMVLDGDGSLLMQLGSLVTIAGAAPRNYYHFVFDNGLYETTGNQPLPARVDFCGLARSAGYRATWSFDEAAALRAALPAILTSEGPAMIRLAIAREDAPIRWPKVKMADQVVALKERLAGAPVG
jgi:sulfopyruvate decarboxylase subunit beta